MNTGQIVITVIWSVICGAFVAAIAWMEILSSRATRKRRAEWEAMTDNEKKLHNLFHLYGCSFSRPKPPCFYEMLNKEIKETRANILAERKTL